MPLTEEPKEALECQADFIGRPTVADRCDPKAFRLLERHAWNR